jgi:spore maturation protein CgeB
MRFVIFTQSLLSCWNHGNAHFLRGVVRALRCAGHDVRVFEPRDGWSRTNLIGEAGQSAVRAFSRQFPDLAPLISFIGDDVDRMLDGARVILVHEWTEPDLVRRIGLAKPPGSVLLFHDTHHRAVSHPAAMAGFDLSRFDGVLAYGESLAEVYRRLGWGERAFVWHEAADTSIFAPPAKPEARAGAVWIGNWGDDERSAELESYLLRPLCAEGVALDIHGVRYPPHAIDMLKQYGARYHGWVANADAPSVFARHRMTLHIPRRVYATRLPGIPTIRVFEALACGIPLISAPWRDSECLFRIGADFLMADTPETMRAHIRAVQHDAGLREALAASGLATIRARHTCGHRVQELLHIVARLRGARAEAA